MKAETDEEKRLEELKDENGASCDRGTVFNLGFGNFDVKVLFDYGVALENSVIDELTVWRLEDRSLSAENIPHTPPVLMP